jgi:hypothetical protein
VNLPSGVAGSGNKDSTSSRTIKQVRVGKGELMLKRRDPSNV